MTSFYLENIISRASPGISSSYKKKTFRIGQMLCWIVYFQMVPEVGAKILVKSTSSKFHFQDRKAFNT